MGESAEIDGFCSQSL